GRISITTFALTPHIGLMEAKRNDSFLIPPHAIACLGYTNPSYPLRCTQVASPPLSLPAYSSSPARYPLGRPFSHVGRYVSHALPSTQGAQQVPSPPYRSL